MVEPIDIDVDDQRELAIDLYGLKRTDEARTFYYDETNNHRLLYLREDGFNVPDPRPFVLGGVAHPGSERPIELEVLRRWMGIQPRAPELKFERVAHGDFLTMLGSKRLDIFLNWLSDEGYLVHFIALDPVYYSYVDIIDSMPAADPLGLGDRLLLKNDLYRVLRRNLGATQDILRRNSYPAIAHGDVRGFLNGLIDLVENADDLLPHFHLMMLKGVLQSGRSLSSLIFLDDVAGQITKDFSDIFIHRLCLFKASRHILDTEEKIRALLEQYRFIGSGRQLDLYRFVDSKVEPGVQLSDVVVGLLGATLTWLRDLAIDEIPAINRDLTPAQNGNRLALASLIERSIAVSDAFVQKAVSLDDMRRLEIFLDR
ncbi:hypothetical protein D0Z70_15795 [Sphingobium terrigena]|uniref:DUF3800 domain-containing protein n=1 Tax=Sphingobium terrigena TaxID=2304063 RepID=A0A418YPX2_9SPHN|nr:DUF3800 domain-containing protein [Sphingobium terrigena]RJG53479.1 hypothetical protein D0Z70_15795 [Sphingobium terrigena]